MISEETLIAMCKEAGIPKGKYENERFIFTLKQVNNFYYEGSISVEDISNGFVDGTGDGGIDFIFIKDDQLLLVQGKTGRLDKDDIVTIFEKIKLTIKKIEDNNISDLDEDMVRSFLNTRENLEDQSNIKLVLFVKGNIDDRIEKHYDAYNKFETEFEIDLIDEERIEERIAELDPNNKVEHGELKIDDASNVLTYGNGIIVNVSANSLKTLCVQNSKKGLFSYNLRGKVSGLKVDSGIEDTIENEPAEFWYRNNGITIGCENFEIDNDNCCVKLEQFSIINGAQTTTNIKGSDSVTRDKDFSIVCKIIKTPDNLSIEEAKDYLQTISVASNSQKPITPQDIRSNDSIQLSLRQKAKINHLPFEVAIKRPIIYEIRQFEAWQQIDNSVLGQLILSCICQIPGTAKTSKSKIMDDDKYYNYVFAREYNIDNYFDLLLLYKKFNDYKKNQRKYINELSDEEKDDEIINQFYICKEGVLCVLSVIYALLSQKKELTNMDSTPCPIKDHDLKEINFKYRIFDVESIYDINEKIEDLFSMIIENISAIYNDKHLELDLSNQAYFLKNNTNYKEYIIPKFIELYNQRINGKPLRTLLEEVFCLD